MYDHEHPIQALLGLLPWDLERRLSSRFNVPWIARFIWRDDLPLLQLQNQATHKVMRFRFEELDDTRNPLERLFERILTRYEQDRYDNYT